MSQHNQGLSNTLVALQSAAALFAAACPSSWASELKNPGLTSPLINLAGNTQIETTASRICQQHLRQGVNISGLFDVPPGETWGRNFSTNDWQKIKQLGFDHIRLPVRWHDTTRMGPAPQYKINETFFLKVDQVINDTIKTGLGVVLDVHGFDSFNNDPAANKPALLKIWSQIANRYKNQPEKLAFELFNEPCNAATTQVMNPIYTELLREVRLTNPSDKRLVFISPDNWSHLDSISELTIPAGDKGVGITCHSYEPWPTTHQGTAAWTGPIGATVGIKYPGPPATPLSPHPDVVDAWVLDFIQAYNTLPRATNPSGPTAFRTRLKNASDWSKQKGVPLYIGEFGAFTAADHTSRVNYLADMTSNMRELKLPFAVWDYDRGFAVLNSQNGQLLQGMQTALFGCKLESFKLSPNRQQATVEFSGLPGRTYHLEQASSLSGTWTRLLDKTFTNTQYKVTLSINLGNAQSTFFRVRDLGNQ